MPRNVRDATDDHRLARWYRKSGFARFCDTMEFRAKGRVELCSINRRTVHGTFSGMDAIRIINSSGTGRFRRNIGYGWEEGSLQGSTTFVLPANAGFSLHLDYEHRNRSISLHPTLLETRIHVPAERIVAAFERISNSYFTKHCVNSLVNEIWHNSAMDTGWLGELFCDSASLALVAYLLSEELRFDQQIRRGGLAPHQMRMLIDFMSSRLSNKVKIAELAGIAGLSEYHFIRAFRRQTGVTPYQYILRMRINRATELLRQHPNKGIEEIALLCGFCSASTLGLQFKRVIGISPRSYRDRL
ncbi:MAG: helix-turn-helix domain-containing protein [Phyllobacterium sp.]|uniref:helix-turn-helix domain-containing protein n=1 Tax=Phyllobacterium sp. TaxID=1871046 RepID=UPI0030F0C409